MNFTEHYNLRGEVVITITDNEGTRVVVEDKNLIVLNGRKKLAEHMLSGSGAYIFDVAFGSNGTPVGDPNLVKPVLPTETSITKIPNMVSGVDYTFRVDSSSLNISYARPKLVYSIGIPTSTGLNSKPINEMALLLNTSPNTAFAIKRFATITKSTDIAINITWTIYF